MFRNFFVFLFSNGCVPIGEDQSILCCKIVAIANRIVAKLIYYFCLLTDFSTLFDKDCLNPVAMCSDANANPDDCTNTGKDV